MLFKEAEQVNDAKVAGIITDMEPLAKAQEGSRFV
jgi:hypothetical protein